MDPRGQKLNPGAHMMAHCVLRMGTQLRGPAGPDIHSRAEPHTSRPHLSREGTTFYLLKFPAQKMPSSCCAQ